MNEQIKLLDSVALMIDLPEKKVKRGQVGTVVEKLSENVFEIEFSNDDGEAYAFVPIQAENLIVLYYQPFENVT